MYRDDGGWHYLVVTCDECGAELGYQDTRAPADCREHWRHNRCPARIARRLGLLREEYDKALGVATLAIAGAYPDFPNGELGNNPKYADLRHMRADIAAGAVLESLSLTGFIMGVK